MINLYDYQIEAVNKMKNGCILAGDVGTGKSRTSLAYYYIRVCGGSLNINGTGRWSKMRTPRNLYIITTAKKRDSREWEEELLPFGLGKGDNKDGHKVAVVIDSWNNIKKYTKVYGAFFIFDEQRVVGSGSWVKSFLDITRKNSWILLSATPGDTWSDYIPVFVANRFYKNRTEFSREHCVYARFAKYPKIERYVNEGILLKHRMDILIEMHGEKHTVPHHIDIYCDYDRMVYKSIWKDRWDPYDQEPILETGKLFYLLRRAVNADQTRLEHLRKILESHRRCIVFYNYTYELESIRALLTELHICSGEWNGQLHTEIPDGDRWVYLVQYIAGSEGWNCISTDTIVFYSQSYSYRQTKQAEGRIDRANTSYVDLYYYHLKSKAPIDVAIERALRDKHNFNEKTYLKRNTRKTNKTH